jgi:hypothetical protein
MKPAKMVDSLRRELVKQWETFVFETVSSVPAGEKLAFLKDAATASYVVFFRHAERAAKLYGVDERTILVELGRRRTVGAGRHDSGCRAGPGPEAGGGRMINIEALAERLDTAAMSALAIPQLFNELEVRLDDAYRIQAASIGRRLNRGDRRVGMEMGFTNRAKMLQMGVSDMILGSTDLGHDD